MIRVRFLCSQGKLKPRLFGKQLNKYYLGDDITGEIEILLCLPVKNATKYLHNSNEESPCKTSKTKFPRSMPSYLGFKHLALFPAFNRLLSSDD